MSEPTNHRARCTHCWQRLNSVCPDPTDCHCRWHGEHVGRRCSKCGTVEVKDGCEEAVADILRLIVRVSGLSPSRGSAE